MTTKTAIFSATSAQRIHYPPEGVKRVPLVWVAFGLLQVVKPHPITQAAQSYK